MAMETADLAFGTAMDNDSRIAALEKRHIELQTQILKLLDTMELMADTVKKLHDRGPMVSIRARGPVSVSKLAAEDEDEDEERMG